MLGWGSVLCGVRLQLAALVLLLVSWPILNGAEGSMAIKCKQSERAALLDLKKAAEDVRPGFKVPAEISANWFKWDEEDKECCNWQGIVCDATSGSITQLRLPTCGDYDGGALSSNVDFDMPVPCSHAIFVCGPLPSSLSRLESLEVLDVRGGCFSDALPSHTFSSLVNLSYLDLSGNPFTSLPDTLLLPPGLIYLNLSNYLYVEAVSSLNLSKLLSSLPNTLEYLDLHKSALGEGVIPEQIGSLHHLKYLDLSNNFILHGPIPQQICSLQNLSYLDLVGRMDDYESPVPWPSCLANLSHLSHLGLENVEWPEAHDDWQCNWKALESLSAYHIRFVSGKSLPFCLHDPAFVTQLKHLQFSVNSDQRSPWGWGSSIAPLLHSLSHANAPPLSLRTLSLPRNSLWKFETEDSKPAWLQALHTPFLEVLDLSHNNLTGIPFWLTHVPLLHSLDMSGNDLPTFPPQLEHLPALKSLTFSSNKIKGTIPLSLLQPSLLYLDVSSNRLSSFFLGNLSSLSHLDLSDNNDLSGEIPHSIGNLSSLVFLDLSSNSLEGNIPHSIGNLSSLVYLDLSSNSLEGNIPLSIGNLLSLEIIRLSGNSLTGTIAAGIFQDSLQYLGVSGNQLVGSLPKLQNCSSLSGVDMSNNNLSESLLVFGAAFQHCPRLTVLYLFNNSLSGSLSLNFCNNLLELDISKNEIRGEIPREVGNCSSLIILNLSDNLLFGALPEEIGNISSLEILAVSNNFLTSLGNLGGLNIVLALHHNNLNGALPTALQNCSALAALDLSYNQLSGSIPRWISGQHFPQLQVLMLSSNQLQSTTPELASLVQNLTVLQILGLASNRLTGSIPSNLKLLQGMVGIGHEAHSPIYLEDAFDMSITVKGIQELLTLSLVSDEFFSVLDFSDNLLEGEIPPEIGALQGLQSLNLSHNLLNGTIPRSLGKLARRLESLDLNHNKLTGSIPSELCNFNSLGYLDLSHNQLQGAISASSSCTHLCTFDASRYADNDELLYECGATPIANTDQETHTLPEADDPPNFHQTKLMAKLQESISLAGWATGHVVGFLLMSLFLYRRARS